MSTPPYFRAICLTLSMFFLWMLLLYPKFVDASEPSIVLDNEAELVDVRPYLSILEDKSRHLSLDDLIKNNPNFKSLDQSKPIRYSLSAWWLSFSLSKQTLSNQSWYLQADSFEHRAVKAYLLSKDKVEILKPVEGLRKVTFSLDLDQSKNYRVYIRYYNENTPLNFNLKIKNKNYLIENIALDHALQAFLIGGLLTLSIYNLIAFFSLKESTYLSLSIFIFFNTIGFLAQTGLLNLFYNYLPLSYVQMIFGLLTVASANSVFAHFMSLSCRLPSIAKLFKLHLWISIISALFVIFMPFGVFIIAVIGSFLLVLAGIVLFILYRANIYEAKVFLVSFFVILLCSLPIILVDIGLINDDLNVVNVLIIGILLFVILLSFNQSEHTRKIREQAQQAELSTKAKDTFLMTMSHELRTPMHAIVSSGTLLQQTELNTLQRNYVDRLQVSAQHMLNVINNILDFSRVRYAEPNLQVQAFTLGNILDSLDNLLRAQAQQKGLNLILHSEYKDYTFIGDSISLSRVLLNLLSNSIKFTHIGYVSLHIQVLNLTATQANLYFAVTDSGIGLSLEEQEHLFEPFFQANSSVSRPYGGTGLGLAISAKLVQRLGGELKVESRSNRGACFFFTISLGIPEDISTTKPIAHAEIIQANYQNYHVLLVDDDHLNQILGKELLTALGLSVDLAESGLICLQKAKHNHYDLIFMDISMPELDGYQVTQQIRAEARFAKLPIVALTAHALSGERERCLAAGMNDYLAKPFSIQELETMLGKWLPPKH